MGKPYNRACRTCGRPIQMRQMPHEQWVAWETDGSNLPHECHRPTLQQRASDQAAATPPMTRVGGRQDVFQDLEFADVSIAPASKRPRITQGTQPRSNQRGWNAPSVQNLEPHVPVQGSSRRSGTATVIVCHQGTGDERTISGALRRARGSTMIVVRAGSYQELLDITRPVELIAETPGSVFVQSPDATCARISTNARINGIAFTVTGTQVSVPVPAVEIISGKPIIDRCVISSRAGVGVSIHGPDTDPTIRRCDIHRCSGAGIRFTHRCRGTVEDNTITECAGPGVWIEDGADPKIRRNRVHLGNVAGILVSGGGRGSLIDNDILENRGFGLAVLSGGSILVQGTKIRNGKSDGIVIRDDAGATLDKCEIAGNTGFGIVIGELSRAHVQTCRVTRNGQYGVVVEGGAGWVRASHLLGNVRGAKKCEGTSRVEFSGNVG